MLPQRERPAAMPCTPLGDDEVVPVAPGDVRRVVVTPVGVVDVAGCVHWVVVATEAGPVGVKVELRACGAVEDAVPPVSECVPSGVVVSGVTRGDPLLRGVPVLALGSCVQRVTGVA